MERLSAFSLTERLALIGLTERLISLLCLLLFGQTGLVAQGAAAAGGQVILLETAVTSAEIIIASVKYLVLAQFTGQGAVKQGYLGRRFEAYLVKTLVVIADNLS